MRVLPVVFLLPFSLLAACQGAAETPASLPPASVTSTADGEEAAESTTATRATATTPAEASDSAETGENAGSQGTPTPRAPAATPSASGDGQGNADVVFVRAVEQPGGAWTFHVTVQHPDMGWEDYADGWDVMTPDGRVLKSDPEDPFTRLLLHPHVDEQPFTRSQSGLIVPPGVSKVTVRAHDLVDGYGGNEVAVDLSAESGPDFEVERQS